MKTYLPALDGLRGVAALAVVGSHFENLSGISLHLEHSGVAVDFFFILSGFVIAQAYEHRLREGLSWRGYLTLRLQRLYPAIAGGLLLGLAVAVASGGPVFSAMSLQFLMLPVIWGPSLHGGELFPLNGPQWSLFLELTINAAHAATIRWITPHRMIAITAASAGVLVWTSVKFGGLDVGWSRQTFWGGPPRVVYGFVVGLLIFRCRLMGVAAPRTPYALVVLALGACLFRPFAEILPNSLVDPMLVIVVLPTLVAFAVTASVPTAALPFVTILGAVSYPLYAIHAPILRGFEAILDTLPDGEARLGWAIALPMVVVSGFAFERFFDAPIRGWLRRRTA